MTMLGRIRLAFIMARGNIIAALNAINTHHVFGIGVLTGALAIAVDAAAPAARLYLGAHATHFGGAISAQILLSYINVAQSWATATLPPALFAAAFGRPPNVPAGPVITRPPLPPTPGLPVASNAPASDDEPEQLQHAA
jgi:hypothetical protein